MKNPLRKLLRKAGVMSLVNNSDYFSQKVIRGSFHQGDARFGWNRNRQCAVNSITAVMMGVLKDVDMDNRGPE